MDAKPISPIAARVAVATMFFANGCGFATWASRIPAIRQGLGLDDGQLGTALFALGAGALLAFPLAGRGCVRHGARLWTVAAGLVYVAALALPPLASSLTGLALALLLVGFANGAMDVSMNALAVEVEAYVGKPIMSSLHGMWSAGGLAGATLGGLIARQGVPAAWHLADMALVLGLAVLLARRWLPASPRSEHVPGSPRFARPDAGLAGLGLIVFCSFPIEGAMADWSAVFLHDALGATASVAALGYAAFSLTMMLMRFAGDRVTANGGAVGLLRYANALAGITLAAALWTSHVGLTILAFALIGLGVATVAPLVFGAAAKRARRGPGHGIAAMATLGYAGFLIGPPVIGWFAQITTLQSALGVLAFLALGIVAFAHHVREPA